MYTQPLGGLLQRQAQRLGGLAGHYTLKQRGRMHTPRSVWSQHLCCFQFIVPSPKEDKGHVPGLKFLHCSFLRQSTTAHLIPSLHSPRDSVFRSLLPMRQEDVLHMADTLVGSASHLPHQLWELSPHLLLLVSKPTKTAGCVSVS